MVPRPAPTHHILLDMATGDRGMPTHQKPRVWSALPPLRPGGVPAPFSWIVVNSKPSRERSLRDALDIAGFSTLLLFVQEERIKRRMRWGREYQEKRKKDVLAFPGYVFACTGLDAPDWRRIATLDDVASILGADAEHPFTVPPPAMAAFFHLAYSTQRADPLPALFEVGSAYVVKDGPFIDHVGVCTWTKDERLKLLMRILGRDAELEFGAEQVEVQD